MTLAEVHVKWSVISMDLLGPDILSTLWMKGKSLHRERAHLKVPGWSLVWNVLLTKKLPRFLSRVNEFRGGCEKIVSVLESFRSNLKFLRRILLTAWYEGEILELKGKPAVCAVSFDLNIFAILIVNQLFITSFIFFKWLSYVCYFF